LDILSELNAVYTVGRFRGLLDECRFSGLTQALLLTLLLLSAVLLPLGSVMFHLTTATFCSPIIGSRNAVVLLVSISIIVKITQRGRTTRRRLAA
jgi:hypothetical protein